MRVLFYRPNKLRESAEALGVSGAVYRTSKFFYGPGDIEWFQETPPGEPNVPYEEVYVLAGSENLAEVVDAYESLGCTVRVVTGGVPDASRPKWLLQMPPDQYLRVNPSGPNADLARQLTRPAHAEA